MRYIITVLCLATLCVVGEANGQAVAQRERERAVVVPPEIILPVIASQPDCPLQFENARLIKYFEGYLAGKGGEVYQLRNRAAKPIRSYRVGILVNTAGGGYSDWPQDLTGKLLMPGQTSPLPDEGSEVEIVRLSDELRDKLQLRGPTKGVVVFMVVRVEFADGATYSDESTLRALSDYFEKVAAKFDRD